jgi:hypothetical protein
MEQRRKLRKGFVSYFKSNGIVALHVDGNHVLIVKNIGEKMNSYLKSPLEKQHAKKRHAMNKNEIFNFWGHRSLQKG